MSSETKNGSWHHLMNQRAESMRVNGEETLDRVFRMSLKDKTVKAGFRREQEWEKRFTMQLNRAIERVFKGEATPQDITYIDQHERIVGMYRIVRRCKGGEVKKTGVTISFVDFTSPNSKNLPKAS